MVDDINTRAWKIIERHLDAEGSIPARRVNALVIDIACSYIGAVNERCGTIRKYTDPLLAQIACLERQLEEARAPIMAAEYGPALSQEEKP